MSENHAPKNSPILADILADYTPKAHVDTAVSVILKLRNLLSELYPIMKDEHDRGDGHFSAEQLERVRRELP